jgi:hypothetical protein
MQLPVDDQFEQSGGTCRDHSEFYRGMQRQN